MSLSNITKDRNVVIGVDGTEVSLQALRHVAGIIGALGAKAIIVFVRHLPVVATEPGSEGAYAAVLESLDDLEREVKADIEAIFKDSSVSWSLVVREGDPAVEIVAVAHEHEAVAVAVGSTIHGALSSILVSSVAEHLLHHCDITLIIVRPDKDAA